MAKIKFHKIAAVVVLIATTAWIVTGRFSSVGSASQEAPTPRDRAEATTSNVVRTVKVTIPQRTEHARSILLSGETEADKSAELASRTGGIVQDLPIKEGTQVNEGDLILRLDTEGKQAAVESARQAVAQRRSEAEAAERLAESGNLPRLQLDAARSALASAQSALETAQADLDRVTLHAPFSGIINKVNVEKGSSVSQGENVATLLKLDPIIAAGEVSEHNLDSIKIGDPAEVRLVNGDTLNGKIRFISHAASPKTRTYRVEIAIPNPHAAIPAGMTADIAIKAKKVETVALPRSVVTLNSEGELGIRSVDKTNEVHFHKVSIVDDTEKALYLAGVPAGTNVIVAGQDFVTEGDKVKTQELDLSDMPEIADANLPQAVQGQ